MRYILMMMLISFLLTTEVFSDEKKSLIREGNKLFKEEKFNDAEIKYRKAQEIEYGYKSTFNLGDALYKQGNFEEATQKFKELTSQNLDKNTLAKVNHNLGNSYFKAGNYEESLKSYKDALKLNPKDSDTRYNLELARQMIKVQQENQKNENQKNKDDKQDNKDKQQGDDQNKDNQQQQNKDKQNEQNKDDKQNDSKKDQKQNPNDGKGEEKPTDQKQDESGKRPYEISKEDAERMLNAIQKDEKNLQKKLRKQKGERNTIERNW